MSIIQNLRNIRSDMHTRCNNPNFRHYKNYGGRGITLCAEWTGTSKNFIEWALLNGYKPGLEIDRKDNDKGYYPVNCRWVTTTINARNRRRPSTNSTGFIGVVIDRSFAHKLQPYRIHLKVNGKVLLNSRHKNPYDAAVCREEYIQKHSIETTQNFFENSEKDFELWCTQNEIGDKINLSKKSVNLPYSYTNCTWKINYK